MVSTTTCTAAPIAAFGPCFNDTPIKAGIASVATPALAVAMGATPPLPPGPSPRPAVQLETVAVNGVPARSVPELIAMGKTGNTTTAGQASETTPASFSEEESFKRDTEYFKALLAARQEMVAKYASKLTALRSLRARNNRNIRKRSNIKARKSQKARFTAAAEAARSAGTEAGAVATGSEATTTHVESLVTTGSVGSRSVGGVVGGRGGWHDDHCRDVSIDGGRICASPVSMEDDDTQGVDCGVQFGQEIGGAMYMKEGMYYSA